MFSIRKVLNHSSVKHSNLSKNLTSYSSDLVRLENDATLQSVRIRMCNEKQRNSLGIKMITELSENVDKVAASLMSQSAPRVLIVCSSNTNVFSSGHNLKEFNRQQSTPQDHEQVFAEFTKLCMKLKRLPIPTIAEVYGLAAAAGYQLAASCDLIVASSKANFSTPGVKFGVFCSTPGVALSRNVSSKISLKMLFTGEPISARDALAHGIISEVVDVDGKSDQEGQDLLVKQVNQLVNKIKANSAPIIALGKECFYKQIESKRLEEAYEVASKYMVDNLRFRDTQDGLKAFSAKQKPVWSHSNHKLD
jgi:enoyl-CoA hydratase/carnithine racemase